MALKMKKYALLAWLACACAAIAIPPPSAKAQATETVLHNFQTLPTGGYPATGSALIQDPAGNLYGTASGGPGAGGVAYKVDTSGRQTLLYAFADSRAPTSGITPSYPSSLTRDAAGNLYGTTFVGGSAGFGVVFKLDPTGHETVLYNFTSVTFQPLDSSYSSAGVILDAAGNLYGTTYYGGITTGNGCFLGGCGVVYKLDPAGQYSVLYSFTGGADGANPTGGLVLDSAGNLYGTTVSETIGKGANYNGAIYKLDPAGQLTVLCKFGKSVLSSLTLDSAGNLYGTAAGLGGAGYESVFKVDPAGAVTALYTFTSDVSNAFNVLPAGVVRDAAGNLYGTTFQGGSAGMGFVYKLDPSGNETVLHTFKGGSTDGAYPVVGVIVDAAGNLYGTTEDGGPTNAGVVFKLDATGNETLLHSFFVGYNGILPSAGVIGDTEGHLYGTTSQGGLAGFGVVYRLDATVGETVLHTFTGGTDGNGPNGLIRDSAGNLYGTTVKGGSTACTYIPGYPGGCGVVYSVDATGTETVLYRFTGAADGANPAAGVIRDSAGNLYGTTEYGGAAAGMAGSGVVYKLDAAGDYSVLYTFTGGADGGGPLAGVILDSAGNLYGTTAFGGAAKAGVVYKVDPTGKETVLYSFTGGADGGTPYAGVIRDSAGNLYGTTYEGGHFAGVVYKLDPSGTETVLHTFTEGAGGGGPYAGVIGDSAGNLYGTTYYFGASTLPQNGWGVVYKLNAAGYTVLYTFSGGADGSYPQAGLIRDSAGNLYGTTVYGGRAQAGTVFRITPQ